MREFCGFEGASDLLLHQNSHNAVHEIKLTLHFYLELRLTKISVCVFFKKTFFKVKNKVQTFGGGKKKKITKKELDINYLSP